jgi:hypothetical protein
MPDLERILKDLDGTLAAGLQQQLVDTSGSVHVSPIGPGDLHVGPIGSDDLKLHIQNGLTFIGIRMFESLLLNLESYVDSITFDATKTAVFSTPSSTITVIKTSGDLSSQLEISMVSKQPVGEIQLSPGSIVEPLGSRSSPNMGGRTIIIK